MAVLRKKAGSYIGSGAGTIPLGSDPELFCVGKSGVVIPAWKFLPSKAVAGGGPYWDGWQAEFNTSPRACLAYFTDQVQAQLRKLYTSLQAYRLGARLTIKNGIRLSERARQLAAEEHVALGCAPSMNAYGEAPPMTLLSPRQRPERYAGWHMHFGLGPLSQEAAVPIVKLLDKMLGVALVSLCQGYEDTTRRTMYGRAGEYRLPPHGLEYRVPSSAIGAAPGIHHLVYELGRQAVRIAMMGLAELWDCGEDEARRIINSYDVAGAQAVLDRNADVLKQLLHICTSDPAATQLGFSALRNGMRVLVADPDDVAGNWQLTGGWEIHSSNPKATFGSLTVAVAREARAAATHAMAA
jgi:hypothetical protein